MVNSKELIGDIVITGVGYIAIYQQSSSLYINKKIKI
jgi:hypothetical protein